MRLNAIARMRALLSASKGSATALTMGAVIGQGCVVAATPLLTRIYSAEQLGLLSSFTSSVLLVSAIAAGRYDAAIVTVNSRLQAALLVGVGIACAFPIAFIAGLVFQVLAFRGYVITGGRLAAFTAILMIVAVLGSTIYQLLFSWELRGRQYGVLGRTRVAQGIVQALWQIGVGLASQSTLGLLMGDAAGRTSGVSVLARRFGVRRFVWLLRQPMARIIRVARDHVDFPRVLVPSILINTFSLQIPTLLILGMYGAKTAGQFAVAQRVVGLPMRLLGATVAQTYLTEVSHKNRTEPSGLLRLFNHGVIRLGLGALLLIVVISLLPRGAYVVVFGHGWGDVRDIARWVAFAAGAQFVGSPLAQTLIALRAQRTMLAWDILRLVVVVLAFRGAFLLGFEPVGAIATYAIGASAAYLALIAMCYVKVRAASQAPTRLVDN